VKWWPTSLIGGERLGFAKTVAAGKEHGPEKRRKLIRPPIEWLLKAPTFEHVLMHPLQAETRRTRQPNDGLSLFVFGVNDLTYHKQITNRSQTGHKQNQDNARYEHL
jgi:hypothetical protein